MTAVVGIMNKRGIAIAADSAVTITHEHEKKIVNSGNKMLRLSSAQPVSVMITGEMDFLGTPWDVIVKRYCQLRGNISFPSVEAVVDDFLAYIPSEKQLFYPIYEKAYIYDTINNIYYWTIEHTSDDYDMMPCVPYAEVDDKGNVTNLDKMTQAFRNEMAKVLKTRKVIKPSPGFRGYTLEAFKAYISGFKDIFSDFYSNDYPKAFFECIKDDLLKSVLLYLTAYSHDPETLLVFSGFGTDEEYPSLIAVKINKGFDRRVCYQIDDKDTVHISDKNETAICPYAQSDIMEALLTGIHPYFKEKIFKKQADLYMDYKKLILNHLAKCGELTDDIEKTINNIKCLDLVNNFKSFENKRSAASRQSWLKALKNYDLQDMAHLAENLVAITSFERHVTFKQEGVGGPIDLAIITKNDGFVWLNRKSWYNHQDVGGRYGKFGV